VQHQHFCVNCNGQLPVGIPYAAISAAELTDVVLHGLFVDAAFCFV